MLTNFLILFVPLAIAAGRWYHLRRTAELEHHGPPIKTSLWLGSMLLLIGLETLTILLAWDFHRPYLTPTVTCMLVASAILILHGFYEAQSGWGIFLVHDFDPCEGQLAKGVDLVRDGVQTPRGERVARMRYHRYLVLLSSLLLFGAVIMVTVIGGLIRTSSFHTAGRTNGATGIEQPSDEDATSVARETHDERSGGGASGGAGGQPETGGSGTGSRARPPADAEAAPPAEDFFVDAGTLARLLIIGVSNAVLGALFYVTQNYRRREDIIVRDFDEDLFWASLWFRVGEAALITVVVFFFLLYFADETKTTPGSLPWNIATIPLIGLLIGMRIKQAEGVIKVFSERAIGVFHMLLTGEAPPKTDEDDPADAGVGPRAIDASGAIAATVAMQATATERAADTGSAVADGGRASQPEAVGAADAANGARPSGTVGDAGAASSASEPSPSASPSPSGASSPPGESSPPTGAAPPLEANTAAGGSSDRDASPPGEADRPPDSSPSNESATADPSPKPGGKRGKGSSKKKKK